MKTEQNCNPGLALIGLSESEPRSILKNLFKKNLKERYVQFIR